MPKAIIFDMDGVILDSEVAWPEIEFERYSKLIDGWTREEHRNLTGLSLDDSYRMFRERYGLDMTWEEYSGFYRKAAEDVYCHRCNLIPGCLEMLTQLKENGILLGLASSSPNYWLEMVFNRFPIAHYFDCVVGADDVDGYGKPSPALYLEAIKRLDLCPGECVAIEDSSNGLLSAKRAGLFAIGFRNGHNGEADFSDADMEMEGFTKGNRHDILRLMGAEPLETEDKSHKQRKVITLRETREEHRKEIIGISSKVWEGEDYIPTLWDKWLEEGGFYTIFHEEKIVGCVKVTTYFENEVMLEGLRIDPVHRGKGYASAAVRSLLEIVESRRSGVIRFTTGDEGGVSYHLGRKHGFSNIASFYHRFMKTSGPFKKPKGDGPGKQPHLEHGIRKAIMSDIDEVLSYMKQTDEWGPSKGLLSYGWVFYSLTREAVEKEIKSGLSLITKKSGEISGTLLAHQSEQYPENIDISWLSGSHDVVHMLLSELVHNIRISEVIEISGKTPTIEMAKRMESFGFSRYPIVDRVFVFEKRL